jgi:hypothetical protein
MTNLSVVFQDTFGGVLKILIPAAVYSFVGAIFLRAAAKWIAKHEIKYWKAFQITLIASVIKVCLDLVSEGLIPEFAGDDESIQNFLWILVELTPIPITAVLLRKRLAIPIARASAVACVAFIIQLVLLGILVVVYYVFFERGPIFG